MRPCLITVGLLVLFCPGPASAAEPAVYRLSELVGDTIDRAERDSFGLFPATRDFEYAVILRAADSAWLAEVASRSDGTTTRETFVLTPVQIDRIRFLINNRPFVRQQVQSDPYIAQTLAEFWESVEHIHAAPSPAHEATPAPETSLSAPEAAPPPATTAPPEPGPKEPAAPAPAVAPRVENAEYRRNGVMLGMALGSAAGGTAGSWLGISEVVPGHYDDCNGLPCWQPPLYHVNHPVFWTAACGLTALGSFAGYKAGEQVDRREAALPKAELREGNGARVGCALAATLPGVALGTLIFAFAAPTHFGRTDYGGGIENDREGLTIIPALLTSVCVTVEVINLAYMVGRNIDRRNAEQAAARARKP